MFDGISASTTVTFISQGHLTFNLLMVFMVKGRSYHLGHVTTRKTSPMLERSILLDFTPVKPSDMKTTMY